MADNVPITAGTGTSVASDDITGVQYQRIKLIHGADGVNDGDVSTANPLPVDTREMGGTAVSMNTGVRDAGTQRVTIATDDVVPASQSGTWNITNVSGTVSLPTGAATAAGQLAAGHDVTALGNVAHDGVDSGNPVKVGAVARTALPTAVQAGDRVNLSATTGGGLYVAGTDGTNVVGLRLNSSGNAQMTGNVAHDAADTANPVKIGGRARTTAITAVATNDRVDAVFSTTGGQMIAGSNGGAPTDIAVNSQGQIPVIGTHAHDAVDGGNPQKIGLKAKTSLETVTLVAGDDRTDAYGDLDGVQLVRPNAPLGDITRDRVANTDGASTAFTNFGAVASVRNYVTDVTIFNSSATTVFVDLRDGTAGSVIWTFPAPAGSGVTHPFSTPLRQPTVNTALAFDPSAAVSTLYISVNGFQSKV